MSIRILSEEVINQIAAGEVVERPAHLVKELVENSLDAKARHIQLFISEGGRQITLQDDGMGMDEKDLSLCIERYGTSKIHKGEDLWKLHSFGFRGEALASIAAVTKFSVVSRLQGSEVALRLNCDFGRRQDPPQRCAGPMGTGIYLKELFANIPARLKFLKSPHAEIAQIKRVMKAMALSHPEVEFKVKQGKEQGEKQGEEVILFYPKCKTPLQRVKQVFEQENLYESTLEKKGFEAHALFVAPNESLRSRRQMWLFVQNRWIQDAGLQSAIMGAYTGFVMKSMYPQVVLFLTCPKEDVDVNVHPNKSTLRFRDSQMAFKAVYACFRQGLERTPWVSQVLGTKDFRSKGGASFGVSQGPFQNGFQGESQRGKHGFAPSPSSGGGGATLPSSYTENLQFMENQRTHFQVKDVVLPYEQQGGGQDRKKAQDEQKQEDEQSRSDTMGRVDKENEKSEQKIKVKHVQPQKAFLKTLEGGTLESSTNEFREQFPSFVLTGDFPAQALEEEKKQNTSSWAQLQILGQAALTYVVTQSHEAIIFIDQHASHERVLFESLMLAYQGGKVTTQQLLLPQALSFSKASIEVLQEQQKNLEKLGIYLENTGPHQMAVVALPDFMKQKGLVEELKHFSEELLSMGGSSRIHQVTHDFCASMACHSAIRAGKALSTGEMQALLNEMDRFPLSSFCPHGRPVFVKHPFRKLEREFGRS